MPVGLVVLPVVSQADYVGSNPESHFLSFSVFTSNSVKENIWNNPESYSMEFQVLTPHWACMEVQHKPSYFEWRLVSSSETYVWVGVYTIIIYYA